jgi:ribosome-associated protein
MPAKIIINDTISITSREIRFDATRASGPGGQNVNKVATRITLRFNVEGSPSLTDAQKSLIRKKLAGQIAKNGDLVLHEERSRTQGANRKLALEKFRLLIAGAVKKPRRRIPTSAGAGEREKRLREKKHDGEKKRQRRKVEPVE